MTFVFGAGIPECSTQTSEFLCIWNSRIQSKLANTLARVIRTPAANVCKQTDTNIEQVAYTTLHIIPYVWQHVISDPENGWDNFLPTCICIIYNVLCSGIGAVKSARHWLWSPATAEASRCLGNIKDNKPQSQVFECLRFIVNQSLLVLWLVKHSSPKRWVVSNALSQTVNNTDTDFTRSNKRQLVLMERMYTRAQTWLPIYH